MNAIAPAAVYRSPDPQQQNVNNNPPERSFAAPYTANVFGGVAKFQPIPTVSFFPRTYATIAARLTPIPGGPSAGVSATARFDPVISLRPNDSGGLTVSFAPKMQLEVGGSLRAGIPNILGTGVGFNVGGSLSQRFTFGAPEFSATVQPSGELNFNANLKPSIVSQQLLSVNGGLEGSLASSGVSVGGGVNQSVTHITGQHINVGGPGLQFTLSPTGKPTIAQNFDNTLSITNSYTFSPRTSVNANVRAGQVGANGGGGVSPSFTLQHKVTFSTDLTSKSAPKHEFSAISGVFVDGSFGLSVSLLPPQFPLSVTAQVGADPRVSVSGGGSYTL